MLKSKQNNNNKPLHSSSFNKKSNNSYSKTKNLKARDHQNIKKFNKTIHQLKKPIQKINHQDPFHPSHTGRSKTPSPLRQIQNTQPSAYNNVHSVLSMYKFNQSINKNTGLDNKLLDQNYIQSLFKDSLKQQKKKKKCQSFHKKFSLNNNLVQNLLSKIGKNQNKISTGHKQKKFNQIEETQNNELTQRILQLEQQNEYYLKALGQKQLQIQILNEKIKKFEKNCQLYTLNTFQVVAVFRKLQSQKQNIQIDFYSAFLENRMKKLVENMNYFIDQLKLDGKIHLKYHILQKQLNQAFAGRGKALTQQSRVPQNYQKGFKKQKIDLKNQNNNKQLNSNQHYRSRSSQPAYKKLDASQILIDILSRRDSIPSSRKQKNDNQKASVIKKFAGLVQAHQLILDKGDVITILKKNDNGWWVGMNKGNVGYFPSDCVQT